MRSIVGERGSSATTTFIALEPGMRERLDATIEALIALADALDGDTDLEEQHDQEEVCEDEGAQCDDEGVLDSGIADGDGLCEQTDGIDYCRLRYLVIPDIGGL